MSDGFALTENRLTRHAEADAAPSETRLKKVIALWYELRTLIGAVGGDQEVWEERVRKLHKDLQFMFGE